MADDVEEAPPPPNVRRRRHTPTLLQLESVECGAASLGMILGYHGKIVPLTDLRRDCGVSRDGSKASNVLKAARMHGMDAKGFAKDLDALKQLTCPYIIFWRFCHFLVVEGYSKEKVFLNDPAIGHRAVSWEEFNESYTGVVMTFQPTPEFQRGGRAPSMVRALGDRMKGSWSTLFYCVLAGFLLVLPGLLIPAFTQIFLDNVMLAGRSDWLKPLAIGMGATIVVQAVLRGIQTSFLRRMRVSLSARMSAQFFQHLLRLPLSFYGQRYAGEIANRTQLNEKVATVLSGQLAQTVIDVSMMAFYAALMFTYDPTLTWIGIGFAVLNVLVLRWMSRRRVEANMRQLQEYGKLGGITIAGLSSMETLKAGGLEAGFFARWGGYFANAMNATREIQDAGRLLGQTPTLLASLATMLVLVIGGFHVIEGTLTIGMLVAFQGLMAGFLAPVNTLVTLGSTIQELRGDMARLDDVLGQPVDPYANRDDDAAPVVQAVPAAAARLPAAPVEPAPAAADGDATAPAAAAGAAAPATPAVATVAATPRAHRVRADAALRLRGEVELRGVSFGYSRLDPPLIEDFSLRIMPGQRVALIGGSGSGKSTIAKIAAGLYMPWAGEVLFDGIPRAQVPPETLHRSFAMVDQDILLIEGTVRDNLTLWDPTVPDTRLVRALEDAAILDVVLSLPGGLASTLSEGGSNLSGGQRQRLEIARALVHDPTVLALDEATSALDSETERIISDRLRMRGCSCIMVAHRLSTIRDCDEIIVLDHGKVAERGSHEALWKADGVYASLLRMDEGAAVGGGA